MNFLPIIDHENWYEIIRMGDDVTLIHEPWIKPFFRCNMWHVRGCERDLLFDSGLGVVSLRQYISLVRERPLICVASHTHFDHIGCHHEFNERAVHAAESMILALPRNELTLADRYATDAMFDALPKGWDSARYSIAAAPAQHILGDGDVIDLGNRIFEVIHTPGHSPGGIALYERKSGIMLSGDIIYDGPLIDDAYHSHIPDYIGTLERLQKLKISIVHGGHFPSFGPIRYQQLIGEYLTERRQFGCHL